MTVGGSCLRRNDERGLVAGGFWGCLRGLGCCWRRWLIADLGQGLNQKNSLVHSTPRRGMGPYSLGAALGKKAGGMIAAAQRPATRARVRHSASVIAQTRSVSAAAIRTMAKMNTLAPDSASRRRGVSKRAARTRVEDGEADVGGDEFAAAAQPEVGEAGEEAGKRERAQYLCGIGRAVGAPGQPFEAGLGFGRVAVIAPFPATGVMR